MGTTKAELECHNLLFDIRRSIRYHNRRRAFFDRLDQSTNMLSVIFGSAAVYGVLEQQYKAVALVAAGAVTVLSAINLVVGSSQRARTHADLARQFIALEKRMVGAVPTEALILEMQSERLSIEAEEPPVLHVLNVLCHNEQMRSMGYPAEQMAKVGFWQRVFAQVFDFQQHKLRSAQS
ncbi:hypothetical protein PCO31111_04207 [Pandoraea communis]|uniref:SMODS and SLOG-associating 2TM effector domain-containing protein n=2 Tax=Pandoraea communis TaxID=2508297 RepID=A0A5E4Y024_9BURK|nr:hypothetical protein PCO31111_04207 [Pandoraea communis]